MTHEPPYPPVTFQELPSSVLKSLSRSNTRTGRGGRPAAVCWPGDPVSPGFFFSARSFEQTGDPGSIWKKTQYIYALKDLKVQPPGTPVLQCLSLAPWRETDLIVRRPWESHFISLNLSLPFYKIEVKRILFQFLGLLIIRANSCQVLIMEPGTQKALNITCNNYLFCCSS